MCRVVFTAAYIIISFKPPNSWILEEKKSWSKSHFILGKLRVGVTSTAALQQSRAGPGRAGPGWWQCDPAVCADGGLGVHAHVKQATEAVLV